MWISWTQRPGPRVPTTHLQNLHNTSIALRYGAIELSLPMSCPDPAVYILTGILPIEAQIHIKALTFFNNVCHQGGKKTLRKSLQEDN